MLLLIVCVIMSAFQIVFL